ncbi:MAG: TonB-dependent receptor domain-containing protein, partial [Gemmatimonadota bacterium]
MSAEDGSPVTSAEIRLEGTDAGDLTDVQGRYFLGDVPPGDHRLVVRALGHATKTVTDLAVRPGETTRLDVTLETEAVAVGGLTVTADHARGSAARMLDRQRTAGAVTDAVGSEQISRSGASDAAGAARQLGGVTVTEGKYAFVRGLGERYSQTSLNGSPLASPEPEKGVVPLDLFPAGFLESVTTQKTYSPDLPGEFSGGQVDLEVRDFPSELTFEAEIGMAVNTRSQFSDGFLSYRGGGLDFLGVDDGARALPGAVVSELGGLGGEPLPRDPEVVERIGESFLQGSLDTFGPSEGGTPANLPDFGFSVGNRTELLGIDLGYYLAGGYSNRFRLRDDELEREWEADAFDPELVDRRDVEPDVDYSFVRSFNEVEWGGVGNVTFLLSPRHEISLRGLFNRNAEDEARRFAGPNREDFGAVLTDERLRFVSRSLGFGQLAGEHRFEALGGSEVDWQVGYSRAGREEPGLREAIYERSFTAGPDEPFTLSDVSGQSGRYLFTDLVDEDLNGKLDWALPFGFFGGGEAELKVGGAFRTKDRDFAGRRFRWRFRSGVITDLDAVLTPENVVGRVAGPNQLALDDVTEPGDDYDVDEDLRAGYAMLTLPAGPLEVAGGARVERYDLELRTGSERGAEGEISSTDVLPAVNATLALTDDMNLRAAWSRTLDRPKFRELTPFQFTEAASLRTVRGNPELEIAELRNLDLRWEWFPSPGETVSVSAFHKALDRPIEQVFLASAGMLHSYQNARDGELYGAELGFRKRLGFLGGGPLSGLSLAGNAALVESQVRVSPEGAFDPTRLERELQGQSDFTVDASLVYESDGEATEAALFLHVFGDRLAVASGASIPDVIERSQAELDLTLRQRLT